MISVFKLFFTAGLGKYECSCLHPKQPSPENSGLSNETSIVRKKHKYTDRYYVTQMTDQRILLFIKTDRQNTRTYSVYQGRITRTLLYRQVLLYTSFVFFVFTFTTNKILVATFQVGTTITNRRKTQSENRYGVNRLQQNKFQVNDYIIYDKVT